MAEYTPEQRRRVGASITDARKDFRKAQRSRRHPAEVTSDRLGDALARWGDRFESDEADMVATIRHRLEQIAEEDSRD